MAARLALHLTKIAIAVPLLGVVVKVARAKYGLPGEGFHDGGM